MLYYNWKLEPGVVLCSSQVFQSPLFERERYVKSEYILLLENRLYKFFCKEKPQVSHQDEQIIHQLLMDLCKVIGKQYGVNKDYFEASSRSFEHLHVNSLIN